MAYWLVKASNRLRLNRSCCPSVGLLGNHNLVTVVATVFCGKLWNFPSPPQSQPIIPCFPQTIARCLVFLVEFVAFYDLRENSFCRKVIRIDDRISRSNSGGMMGVAGGGHRQTADLPALKTSIASIGSVSRVASRIPARNKS